MKETNSRLPLKTREPPALAWGTRGRGVESLALGLVSPYQPDPHPRLTHYLARQRDGDASEPLLSLIEVIPREKAPPASTPTSSQERIVFKVEIIRSMIHGPLMKKEIKFISLSGTPGGTNVCL